MDKKQEYCKLFIYKVRTKFFIPDHKQIISIQDNLDTFRDYITKKKRKIEIHKTNVEKLLRKEQELDKEFIEEVTAELERQENKDREHENK